MFQTKLAEFENKTGDLLRGILLLKNESNKAVLMAGGFERSTTTEKKFKTLADKLIERDIVSLRFDYAGCGLSNGDFSKTTVKRMIGDLNSAIEFLKEEVEIKNISIICHSLASCILGRVMREANFEKIVLIAPALNQKDLLRYWFAASDEKNKNSGAEINWNNFRKYFDETEFQKDCLRADKITKTNYISFDYFLENKDKDYANLFKSNQNILHIHGDKDDKVPLESLTIKFKNEIIVKDGDHDLERPDMFWQWINQSVAFIR